MADPTRDLVARLARSFEDHRDPEKASAMSAYMRDQFSFYGIPAPAQEAIAREATNGLSAPTEAQLARIARSCWQRPEREWQYFACGYLRRHIKVVSPEFLPAARKLITKRPWWDTVDALATRTVGPLVRAHPALRIQMDSWIDSEDFWLARTAILHQLLYRQETDADRLFDYCLRRAADKEFFIRKAIGWALREYSKTDERSVRSFVHKHRGVLSGLSQREALKWLDRSTARSASSKEKSTGPPQRRARAKTSKR